MKDRPPPQLHPEKKRYCILPHNAPLTLTRSLSFATMKKKLWLSEIVKFFFLSQLKNKKWRKRFSVFDFKRLADLILQKT